MTRPRYADEDLPTEVREARIAEFDDRQLAACIVISYTGLRALDIDSEASSVLYWVDSDAKIQVVDSER